MNPIITDAHGVVCRWRNKRASDGGLVGAVVSDRYMDQLASMKPFDEPDGGRKFSLGAMLVQHVCVCVSLRAFLYLFACLPLLVYLSQRPSLSASMCLCFRIYVLDRWGRMYGFHCFCVSVSIFDVSVFSYLCSRQIDG